MAASAVATAAVATDFPGGSLAMASATAAAAPPATT